MKQTIHKRESEMREVVKTLKQFAEDKKDMEKNHNLLLKDLENQQSVLKEAVKPGYKIQSLQKIRDENLKLVKDKQKLTHEFEKTVSKIMKAFKVLP